MPRALSQIIERSNKPVCLAIGNPSIEKDSLGILLGDKLKILGVECVAGGIYPENYLEKVAKLSPDLVIITDAVIKKDSGDFVITDHLPNDVSTSSHAIPLSTLASYLRQRCATKVLFIGINRSTKIENIEKFINELKDEIHQSARA